MSITESNSERFPLDFDTLQKGDVVPAEIIQKAFPRVVGDVRSYTTEFRLLQMRLKEMIEDARPDLVTACELDTIRILTDLEADSATVGRIRNAVRAIGRNHQRRARIDRSDFTPEQVRSAEHHDRMATMVHLAARKALTKADSERRLAAGGELPVEKSLDQKPAEPEASEQ